MGNLVKSTIVRYKFLHVKPNSGADPFLSQVEYVQVLYSCSHERYRLFQCVSHTGPTSAWEQLRRLGSECQRVHTTSVLSDLS